MQILLLVAVFASFVSAGFYIRHYYKSRKIFFENLVSFCDHLLIEIAFQKNTILKIIDTYGDSYGHNFRNVLNGYQNLIDEKSDITRERLLEILKQKPKFSPFKLKSSEQINVADFFYELGRHGASQENTKIQSKRIIFDNFFGDSSKSLKRDASIYFKLFILFGIGAVILLL